MSNVPHSQTAPKPMEIEQAMGHLRWLCDVAYNDGGAHELGYDPLEVIDRALKSDGPEDSEYICKCGVRVVPHRCSTGEEF